MSTMGRPTGYRPEFCELAANYCLLGATNEELAGFFAVAPRTIDNWIARIPEFAAAVHDGRAVADARVARSLHQRAVGYTVTVRRTVLWRGRETTLTREVHYPADVRACIFWLRNRRRQDWCDRPRRSSDASQGGDNWWGSQGTGERADREDAPREPVVAREDRAEVERDGGLADAQGARPRRASRPGPPVDDGQRDLVVPGWARLSGQPTAAALGMTRGPPTSRPEARCAGAL
jgi:hypothetical protein